MLRQTEAHFALRRIGLEQSSLDQRTKRIGGRPDAPVARQLRRAKSGEEFMRERRLVQAVGVIDVLAPVARQLRRAKSGEEFMRERRLVQAVGVIDVLAPTENRAHWSIWRRRQQLGLNATELALALVY